MTNRFLSGFTCARLYCNHKTREAYGLLWAAFHRVVLAVTGRPISYTALDPISGNIQAILLDAEKAQVQGIGDVLLTLNNPQVSGINTRDWEELVAYFIKMCRIHFHRYALLHTSSFSYSSFIRGITGIGCEPSDQVMLRSFPTLTTAVSITKYHAWCRNHERKGIRDWHSNKASWFWAGLNPTVSKMGRDAFLNTPVDTNLNESGHAGTNRETGIGWPILEAVET